MSETETSRAAAELEDLLDAERQALLDGALDSVGRLHELKQGLLARIVEGAAELEMDQRDRLARKATRNQDLLAGAARGVAAVNQRLKELRAVSAGGNTYTADGRRAPLNSTASVERRL